MTKAFGCAALSPFPSADGEAIGESGVIIFVIGIMFERNVQIN
jgi:hypothetical protein